LLLEIHAWNWTFEMDEVNDDYLIDRINLFYLRFPQIVNCSSARWFFKIQSITGIFIDFDLSNF